ncbi:flagellar biosynthesis anti-sigma factor FlgM [Lysinibacillus sp. 54212]|uniref:flagellar biosynthesis anti-sigma factor FlgM n=1 Tax=Lysinibacillus sp. 54212 TaxID=3119829 RepID=UPI002FC5C5DE
MKINTFGVNSINPYNQSNRQINDVKKGQSFADKLEISITAKEMQGTKNYNTERAERVEKLKEEIASGEYKVDARKVAEDMLKYYRF